jgi:hypothetical protein
MILEQFTGADQTMGMMNPGSAYPNSNVTTTGNQPFIADGNLNNLWVSFVHVGGTALVYSSSNSGVMDKTSSNTSAASGMAHMQDTGGAGAWDQYSWTTATKYGYVHGTILAAVIPTSTPSSTPTDAATFTTTNTSIPPTSINTLTFTPTENLSPTPTLSGPLTFNYTYNLLNLLAATDYPYADYYFYTNYSLGDR